MSTKPFKVQVAAQLLASTTDTVRRMVDASGIEVARQEAGAKTRLFSIENIFELARYRANRRSKRDRKKQVIATVYAPKAGVGKTTLASNFGTVFALNGLRTLIIDLDFQAHLTMSFGYDCDLSREEAVEAGVSESRIVEYHFGNLIPNYPSGCMTLSQVIKKPFGECGPHIVPADLNLGRLDTMLTHEALAGRNTDLNLARLIRDGLSNEDQHFDVSDYDVILFDAAPATNRITRGALLASDFVISPVSMEKFSSKAISCLSSALIEMRDQLDRGPELIIVGTFFDPNRIRVMGQLMAATQTYRHAWLDRSIRKSADFNKALTEESDVPLVLSKPSSQAATDLRESAEALLNYVGLIEA
ncbi:ParA family protein [Paraburkholderia fungorum]|uniref:ParA family protein n=1 Tax=Paraburkholderia fungorum TaxID=134537 RepID=UPI003313C5A4